MWSIVTLRCTRLVVQQLSTPYSYMRYRERERERERTCSVQTHSHGYTDMDMETWYGYGERINGSSQEKWEMLGVNAGYLPVH